MHISQSELDPVRPGENWFFYWKTSAALWESRIKEFSPHEVIFIPLNWGFHAESDGWDFGRLHPERDLLRLTRLLTQHSRNFCWLLPLTPAPFLVNGGVPASAARTLSVTADGTHLAVLDHECQLHKMFSFFEPKVFQAFTHFTKQLGSFLSENHIKAPLWGVAFDYRKASGFESYLTDFSLAFDQGFSCYLKKNFPDGLELNETLAEIQLKNTFTHEVADLLKVSAESALAPFWAGQLPITMLGGAPTETIERGCTQDMSQRRYFQEIFDLYVQDRWLSSALLMKHEKSLLLQRFLNEHFGAKTIDEKFHYEVHGGDLGPELRAFTLVNVIEPRANSHYKSIGLLSYLAKEYPWMYQVQEQLNFSTEWIDAHAQTVKFFVGSQLDRTSFGQMLKLFLMGQRVVLDRTDLPLELDKRLQIFYLENNLKGQQVNYLTSVQISELGEGKFITFEGDKLHGHPEQHKFWGHLFRYFNLNQPEILMEEDVFSLWRIRASSVTDLNYLDVRRVNLYNPTSYKKKVTIHTKKHFAFMKSIDPVRAQASSTTDGVQVELMPDGQIGLDFGHYEELS